jgi:hypothetical protein
MAVGNTFGATALSSYGGFWISFAIILTPGGFEIVETYTAGGGKTFNDALGFFLAGWFIFTTILLLCTLRSTVAFFLLFFFLDMAFLLLTIGHFIPVDGKPNPPVISAAGYFGLFAAFMAWYNALAGIADTRYIHPYPLYNIGPVANLYRPATPSSSSPSRISHGPTGAASLASRPSAKLFKCICRNYGVVDRSARSHFNFGKKDLFTWLRSGTKGQDDLNDTSGTWTAIDLILVPAH